MKLSSFKRKKALTVATRKRTKKRLEKDGLGPEASAGWLKRETLYDHETVTVRKPKNKKGSFIVTEANKVEGEDVHVEPSRDDDLHESDDDSDDDSSDSDNDDDEKETAQNNASADDNNDNKAREDRAGSNGKELSPNFGLDIEEVHVDTTIEDSLIKLSACYSMIRKKDQRVKAKVVIIVETEKYYKRLPPLLGSSIKHKRVPNRGMGNKGVALVHHGFGNLSEKRKADKKENIKTLESFKGGKIHTLFVTDEYRHLLNPIKNRIDYLIQLGKAPEQWKYEARRDVVIVNRDEGLDVGGSVSFSNKVVVSSGDEKKGATKSEQELKMILEKKEKQDARKSKASSYAFFFNPSRAEVPDYKS